MVMKKACLLLAAFFAVVVFMMSLPWGNKASFVFSPKGLWLSNVEALSKPEVEVGPPCLCSKDHICVAFADEGLVLLGYDMSMFE